MTSRQVSPLLRFGVFEADLRAGKLTRNGIRVRLQDLPFRALTLLLSRPGEVITREDFRHALWPAGVFVDFEQGINSAMMRLRDALGDSAGNPVFVETIERRGYRWIAPVRPVEAGSAQVQRPESGLPGSREGSPVAIPAPQSFRTLWRRLIVGLPLLAVLLFGFWMVRPGWRHAKASAKSSSSQHLQASANREAEELYLQGRFYWNKRTPESLHQAVDAFTQAIAHDPNYSDAYVGLADSYNLLREFSVMPANEAYFKAFAAAKKAVELDPQSSDAHATLAFVTYFGMWDAVDAEKEFRHALLLDFNNAKAHHWFATFLHSIGRHDEALSEIQLARKLEPNSSAIIADQGELLRGAGRTDQAVRVLQQLEAAEPDFVSPHRYLRFAYFESGDYPDAIAEWKKEALLTHDDAGLAEATAAGKGLAKGSERGMYEALLAEQEKLYSDGKFSPYMIAVTEARLGNRREAFKYLNICVQRHDEFVLGLEHDPQFTGFHGEPGFAQLLAKIGVPSTQASNVSPHP
jgi:DNA-binding winged helix-turn-helix (wHTH) protein/Tfp pilus assembly protein PilF